MSGGRSLRESSLGMPADFMFHVKRGHKYLKSCALSRGIQIKVERIGRNCGRSHGGVGSIPVGVKREVSFRVSWVTNNFAATCGHVSRETWRRVGAEAEGSPLWARRDPYDAPRFPVSSRPPNAPGTTRAAIPRAVSEEMSGTSSVLPPRK